MTPSSARLLNSHLLLHFELTDPLPRLKRLIHERPLIKGALMERLLLYDELVIPTTDFSVVPVLVSWLGDGLLKEMLDAKAIRFLRYRGALGYAGNGGGLCMFRIEKGEAESSQPWQETHIAEPERALEIWLARVLPNLAADRRDKTISSVIANSNDLGDVPDFDKNVEHETYMDALKSPSLRAFFGLRSTNMRRLHGIESNQMKVFSPQTMHARRKLEETDVLLGMAVANFELHLAELAEADDIAFDPSVRQFLTGKVERAVGSTDLAKGFAEILEVSDLPDLASAVASDTLPPADVWRLRSRESAIQFRRWFHQHVRNEPERARNEYVATLSKESWAQTLPAKVLRFVVTNAASLLPGAGIVASAIDSFLLERIAKGYSPKYLIDDLRHVLPPSPSEFRR